MRMRARQTFLIGLFLFAGLFDAGAEKLDRGFDNGSQDVFIRKGTWMIGGGASYMLHDNDNASIFIVNGLSSNGYTLSVSPDVCYMFKDNLGAGIRVGYKRNKLQLDSASIDIADTDLDFSDYYKLTHSFEIQAIGRYYMPIGVSRRLGLVNELQIAYSHGQGKIMDGHDSASLTGTYETSDSFALNFCPGFMAFISDNFAIDVSVNMIGLQWNWTDQIHNQVAQGKRTSSMMNFKVNLLAIGFSLHYYL